MHLAFQKIIVLLWFACHILRVQLSTWAAPTISFNFGEKEKNPQVSSSWNQFHFSSHPINPYDLLFLFCAAGKQQTDLFWLDVKPPYYKSPAL